MMKRWQTTIIFCVLIALIGVYGAIISPTTVWGQDGTIPTRTPTPGSGSGGPTATSSSPTDTPPTKPPATSQPEATATSISTATATATLAAVTFTPTSTTVSEFPYLEAEQCGEPPTITSLVIVNVYAGPGSDYLVVETLAKDEVRPIMGRAQYAEWWLVLLDETGETGWINNKAGVVNGYTGNVPIVAAPEIDGETPTPGIPWNPTPVSHCTVTPTATATSTETATATVTPTATDAAATSSENSGRAASAAEETKNTETNNTDSTNTDVTEAKEELAVNNSAQSNNRNAEAEAKTEAEATAVPLESASTTSNTNNILPIVGLVLIVGAVFVIIFLRRARGGGEATTTGE